MTYTIVMVGAPNSGKSSLFSLLTDNQVDIGNRPGVTVDTSMAALQINPSYTLVDLPGIRSLYHPNTPSADEKITVDYLLTGDYQYIINVIDITDVERSLYLTLQLMLLNKPMLVVLNKQDLLPQYKFSRLAKNLALPIVLSHTLNKHGITQLHDALTCRNFSISAVKWLPAQIDEVIQQYSSPITALLNIQGGYTPQHIKVNIPFLEDVDMLIIGSHYQFIMHIIPHNTSNVRSAYSIYLDKYLLHNYFGMPIFLFLMYGLFCLAMLANLWCKEPLELGVQLIFEQLAALLPFTALINAIGGGVATVAGFIPSIAVLYAGLSSMELSGYLARINYLLDSYFSRIGLPSQIFVPLILGFGCNVPAIYATRILATRKERIIAIMMTPFMSCGARLTIYSLFLSLAPQAALIVFSLYLIGIIVAIVTGLFVKHIIGLQAQTPLLLELPDYRLPQIKLLYATVKQRVLNFCYGAGKWIVFLFALVNLLLNDSLLHHPVLQSITYFFIPIGITENNWPAVVALVAGIPAKEIAVGALAALYDPAAPLATQVTAYFPNWYSMYSYLLFILLYFPCVSVFATIKHELNWRWAFFSAIWSTTLAYTLACYFYQIIHGLYGNNINIHSLIFSGIILLGQIYFCLSNRHAFN